MFTEFAETLPPPGPARPPGTADDWTIPQNWERFGAEEHRVWDVLYARQRRKLAGRAVAAFEDGLSCRARESPISAI
jgi:phenylalanine-4-hydroxylase